MFTSSKKGFLLIEGVLLFQIVVVIVLILSLLIATMSKQNKQKMNVSYFEEIQTMKVIYEAEK